jgi:hypothetical protein
MRKCVKIILTDFGDLDVLYTLLKKKLSFDDLEGYAEPFSDEELHIVLYGPKKEVDNFVGSIEEIVLKANAHTKDEIGFFVEPFLKDEDYRGVFRFIKKA